MSVHLVSESFLGLRKRWECGRVLLIAFEDADEGDDEGDDFDDGEGEEGVVDLGGVEFEVA